MKRFAITHINEDGLRVLTFANQARNMFDSQAEAEHSLKVFAPSLREKVLGCEADTLEVREVECYENGDAKGIYFK